MKFETKKIKREYRDIKNIMSDILNTNDENMYKTYVSRLINEFEKDEFLNHILSPYFDKKADVTISRSGYWVELEIPADVNVQIAFVLQTLKEFSDMSAQDICARLYSLYASKRFADTIIPWNRDVVSPAFRDLQNKISDLIEDIPEKAAEVDAKSLKLVDWDK